MKCDNCKCEFPGNGGYSAGQHICCPHCVFNPLGCRCHAGEFGVSETIPPFDDCEPGYDDYEPDFDEDYFDDYEPVGSCDECGTNIYPDEDDGSGLCDHHQWIADGCPGPEDDTEE